MGEGVGEGGSKDGEKRDRGSTLPFRRASRMAVTSITVTVIEESKGRRAGEETNTRCPPPVEAGIRPW